MTTLLVVAAHPDDEVLGCGGTMARLIQEGHQVHIAILGEGITSRYDTRQKANAGLLSELRTSSERAAAAIGTKDLSLHGLPDNRFDSVALLDVVKVVEELVERISPDVVYTHHAGDVNIDHLVTSRAVLTATRTMKGHPVRELYAFEVPSSTEWAFQSIEPSFHPNVFVDISGTLEIKVEALSHYESEMREWPHPRSLEGVRVLARRWGAVVGCDAAEAFQLIRAIR